jgi:hypothetical protein
MTRRWRALLLMIKAKVEAVESGVVTFEDEWLAHFVLPSVILGPASHRGPESGVFMS